MAAPYRASRSRSCSSPRVAAGCASAPARFYTLELHGDAGRRAGRRAMRSLVGPVSVPGVGRPARSSSSRSRRTASRSTSSTAGPRRSNDSIARAVAGDLAVLLGTPDVAVGAVARTSMPAYRVTIDVQRFESIPGEAVLIDAVWAVQPDGERRARARAARSPREAVQGKGFDALAAAHSRALAKVSGDIAAAIRAAAATAPEPAPAKGVGDG